MDTSTAVSYGIIDEIFPSSKHLGKNSKQN